MTTVTAALMRAAFHTVPRLLLLALPLFLLIAFLYSSHAAALPFLGPEKDFELRLQPRNESLREAMSAELMRQKENDTILNQFTSQAKIDRYQADIIRRMLRANGYYDAEVTHTRSEDTTLYRIESGPRYTVSEINIEVPEDLPKPSSKLLALQPGQPLEAEKVLAGRATIRDWVYFNLCLYSVQVDYEATVYHYNHTASVTYTLQPSPQVEFGELSITGLDTVEKNYLRARLPVSEGDCFNRQRIDRARLALLQTNLIASVDAQVSEPEGNRVAVTFDITERRHRTIQAGVGYEMNRGPGITLGWEHRNLLGRGQKLEFVTRLSEDESSLNSAYTIPHFLRPDQSLMFFADVEREDPDAYESTTGSVGATLGRQFTDHFFASIGSAFRYSRVLDEQEEEDYFLFSAPLTVDYDRRDDLLNPREGWRLATAIEPFSDLRNGGQFLKMEVTANILHTQRDWLLAPTFAAQFSAGSITGSQRRQVPADLRFYVGGGGSVRGYPYQSLGDFSGGDPTGGKSYSEVALETRLHLTDTWGAVLFLDGGYAYPEELPQLGEDFRWGTGIGLRYLTGFAPIRFDVAVPLDRRPEIDDRFQIYISIGQAF